MKYFSKYYLDSDVKDIFDDKVYYLLKSALLILLCISRNDFGYIAKYAWFYRVFNNLFFAPRITNLFLNIHYIVKASLKVVQIPRKMQD